MVLCQSGSSIIIIVEGVSVHEWESETVSEFPARPRNTTLWEVSWRVMYEAIAKGLYSNSLLQLSTLEQREKQ